SMGSIVVVANEGLDENSSKKIAELAFLTGTIFERNRLSSTLQHFLDRVQILNELNQLIASNVGLERIVKSLARESAFRFAADVAVAFLYNEERSALEPKGGYGCSPTMVPKRIDLTSGILSQVMKTGGHISVNIITHSNHGLKFLEDLGV